VSRLTLEKTRRPFKEIIEKHGLGGENVTVMARPLTPQEAIGQPGRRDFPIVRGKERVVEAEVRGAKGHAFTDTAKEFEGTLAEVADLSLDDNGRRAVYTASMNAAMALAGEVSGTIHCRDDEPEKCARAIASGLKREFGDIKVGLAGLNPALAQALAAEFGPEKVAITDLDPDNVGGRRFGVEVWHGIDDAARLVRFADMVLITGSALVNQSLGDMAETVENSGKTLIAYGVTIAAAAKILNIRRLCPYGRNSR